MVDHHNFLTSKPSFFLGFGLAGMMPEQIMTEQLSLRSIMTWLRSFYRSLGSLPPDLSRKGLQSLGLLLPPTGNLSMSTRPLTSTRSTRHYGTLVQITREYCTHRSHSQLVVPIHKPIQHHPLLLIHQCLPLSLQKMTRVELSR